MPVYEIQDPQGRTLEIDGDHEPTAEELTNIFTQAFPAPAQAAQAQPAPERPALVRAPLPTMGAQGQQMLQTGMEQLSKPLVNIPAELTTSPLTQLIPIETVQKAGQAMGQESAQALSSLTSPLGLATIPVMMVLPEVVGPGMAASMAPQVAEGAKETWKGITSADIPETMRGLTKGTIALAGVAGGLIAPFHGRLLPKSAKEVVSPSEEPVVETPSPAAEPVAAPPKIAAVEQQARRAEIKSARPEVPETPPEPERGLSVIQEIREKGANTRRKVQELFPSLSNETAAKLRDQAFPRVKVPDNLSRTEVDRLFLDKLNKESNEEIANAIPKRETEEVPVAVPPGDRPEVGAQVREQTPTQAPKEAEVAKPSQAESPEQVFFKQNPVGSTVTFRWPEGGTASGVVEGYQGRSLRLNVKGQEYPVFVLESQIPESKPPPLSTAERAEVQEELSQAMGEEPAPAPKLGEVGQLALEEQRKAGWNPKWPFVPTDLANADFRELIRKDPALSAAEKQQIFSAGEKLGVVPKEAAPAPKVEETKPAEPKQAAPFAMTFAQFLEAPREGALLEALRTLPRAPKSEAQISAQAKLDAASQAIDKAGLSWIYDRVDPNKAKMVESALRRLPKTKQKLVNEYESALNESVKASQSGEAGQKKLYDRAVAAGIISDPSTKPPVSPGPGAAASGEPGTYSAIEQLSDRLRTVPSESKADPLNWRERMADTMTAGKNAFAKVVGRLRAISETVKEGARGIRDINDTERAVAVLDRELQTSSGESANLGKVMKRTYKDANMRRAAALYIDAGGDIKQFQDALARGLPQGTRPEVRRAIETVANMSDEGKQLADFLREYYGIREGEAVASDIFKEGLDDYYTHIWKKEANMPEKLRAAITTGKVNTYWQFARQRKISTFLEGIMEGKTPVLDPAEVVPYYNFTLDRAIASRAFVKQLSTIDASDGRPAVAATGTRQEIAGNKDMVLIRPQAKNSTYADYRSVDHPAMNRWKWAETTPDGKTVLYQGELQVHPEFYERLARFMERSRLTPGRTARATLRVGSEMKAAKFGLASLFHQIHVGAHAAFHWANPFQVSKRPWITEDKLINFRHPFVQEAIEKGHLKIAPEPWELNVMSEGILNHGSLIHKVPFIGPWSRVYSEWLFTNYIPKLKLATYEAALPRNRRWFAGKLTDEQIQARVGDAVNNAYGELNRLFLGKYGRDPRFQRALQMAFLAPDFGEARLRFVSKALTKAGAEERLALATMFTTLYTTARIGNYLSHGNPEWDWKKAFSVKVGDHWFSIRSVIGDVDHALADFVQFATVRLSPLSRTLLEGLSKRDARGQKRLPSEQVGDFMRQFIPISLQGVAEPERAMWESFSSAMGLSARRENPEQEVRLMVRDWMKKSKDPAVQNKLARIEKETFAPSEYAPLRSKLRLHDMQGAQEEYRKLRRIKTPQMIDTAMRPTRPLAGSYKMELEFRRSLKPSERSIYNRAKRDREQQYERFLQLPR